MATSIPPVPVPANSTVDLYAATSITVGLALTIQNIGNVQLRVSESVGAPTASTGYNKMNPLEFLDSAATPVGVHATNTTDVNGLLQVEET